MFTFLSSKSGYCRGEGQCECTLKQYKVWMNSGTLASKRNSLNSYHGKTMDDVVSSKNFGNVDSAVSIVRYCRCWYLLLIVTGSVVTPLLIFPASWRKKN